MSSLGLFTDNFIQRLIDCQEEKRITAEAKRVAQARRVAQEAVDEQGIGE